jgi:hypothetical protein
MSTMTKISASLGFSVTCMAEYVIAFTSVPCSCVASANVSPRLSNPPSSPQQRCQPDDKLSNSQRHGFDAPTEEGHEGCWAHPLMVIFQLVRSKLNTFTSLRPPSPTPSPQHTTRGTPSSRWA